jgi:F-type H+-transporting ATPase subunit a
LKINISLISIKLLISIFIFNILINLNNLIPFSFCFNSQFNYLLFLSIILWLSCLIFYFSNNLKNFISHLTPSGRPLIIRPLIVIIEVSRILIRPITLRVRISANIISGHILIHLLTEFSFFLFRINLYSINFSLILLIILNFLEIGVSLIQPYIFCTLINIYLCENN